MHRVMAFLWGARKIVSDRLKGESFVRAPKARGGLQLLNIAGHQGGTSEKGGNSGKNIGEGWPLPGSKNKDCVYDEMVQDLGTRRSKKTAREPYLLRDIL